MALWAAMAARIVSETGDIAATGATAAFTLAQTAAAVPAVRNRRREEMGKAERSW
jgi:hypothetical protein